MIDIHELKKRDLYVNKLIAFQDTEPVKVVTGIRRCGKSSVLKLMMAHLKSNGIEADQILEMNFESYAFQDMTSDDFYHYVKEHIHRKRGHTSFSMKYSAFRNGKTPSIHSALISTAIFM